MGAKRRVAIMIALDWPLGHHYQMFNGILRYARESGTWDCIINPYADLLYNERNPKSGFDGIVARATPRLAELSIQEKIPVVNVWYNSEAKGIPCVLHDVTEAGKLAAQHLLARGFRSFATLGFKYLPSNQAQIASFNSVIEAAGHPTTSLLVAHEFDHDADRWQVFQKQLSDWMDTWKTPMGVLVTTDMLCRYLAEACRERSLSIPDNVALVSCGNEQLIVTSSTPTLTSIDYGYDQIGYRAASLLDRIMDGEEPPSNPTYVAPTALVIRQSTNAFVVDDHMVTEALRFISEHMAEDISVEHVAAHLSTTRRTLSRRFHSSLGRTIHDAITNIRLEHVKQQLIETPSPLKTIAANCGFRDAIHLCKVFQRVEGTSPSEYRSARSSKH